MIQELFDALYSLMHGSQGPLFTQYVYPQSGAALLAWSLIACATYYYVVGWVSSKYNMTRHWFSALALNCTASMLTVIGVCRLAFGVWQAGPAVLTLALIQGLYAAALFSLLSIAIKWGSPNARRTPF